MDAVLEVRDLTKAFDGTTALGGVSLTVRKGETVGLLGPNGAGKTTLIHSILGLIEPTSGSVRVFGLDFGPNRQRILGRANFSSAYTQMPMSLTPRQNLGVMARLYAVRDPDRKAAELLERMEIGRERDLATRSLSSGQLSRLNLAKSLLNDPELLLLDEPTASMDPDIADKTRAILKDIQKERGITILYTSHNMREIELMADRVVFLSRGKTVAEGTPRELRDLFKLDDLEAVFLKIARQGA